MITLRRRIPSYFVSKNICTSSTLKHLDKTPLLVNNKKLGVFWDAVTRTNGTEYRMLDIKENVRVLLISNPIKGEKIETFCSLRLGVGSFDDNRLGLAHLLEHVISTKAFRHITFNAETAADFTSYTFRGYGEEFWRALERCSELMFSTDLLSSIETQIQEHVLRECKRVDGEFHKKRTNVLLSKMKQIFCSKGITDHKFGLGNLKTFGDAKQLTQLINELETFRKFYRTRPVFVCIYSNLQLIDTQQLFQDKFWICSNYSKEEKLRKPKPILNHKKSKEDFRKRLFVVKSDADLLQLKILFPFNRSLNLQEFNTLIFICYFLKYEAYGSLSHYLLHNKIGTSCYGFAFETYGLFVTVNLTQHGLYNIHDVAGAIVTYIKFLHNEWEKLNEWKELFVNKSLDNFNMKNNYDYIRIIAEKFLQTNDEFDEIDLFSMMTETDGKQVVAQQLLENKNVVYSIITREPDLVSRSLNLVDNNRMETESIYKTNFKIFETDIFARSGSFHHDFKTIDLKHSNPNYEVDAFVIQPNDVVYQNLCVANLRLQSRPFLEYYNIFHPGVYKFHVKPTGVCFGSLVKGLDANIKENFEQLNPYKMDDDQFEIVKDYAMSDLSTQMTDSLIIAKSLLVTAIENFHYEPKILPIPSQYEILRRITNDDYTKHFEPRRLAAKLEDTNKLIGASGYINNLDRFDEQFIIKSINKNELCTVTLHFFKVNELDDDHVNWLIDIIRGEIYEVRQELGIYTAECYPENYGHVRGIFLETVTVEKVKEQSSNKILNIWMGIMKRVHHSNSVQNIPQLKSTFQSLNSRKICIQIVGHKEIKDENRTFEEDFEGWFTEHEKDFEKINDIAEKKPHKWQS